MTTIGIDLGTSNSLVAYWGKEGPKIIPNVLGKRLTPSVVSLGEEGELLIGEVAKERLITHPDRTAAVFKRHMGTEKYYHLGAQPFLPEELSSFVLQSLKKDAEAFLGEEITEAIISVPAYFNDRQRKATQKAAELAGLRVERLISEPTAAAIAYGLHESQSETRFLVFDLGGGTFDVSILELFEGVMEVKSIAGDNFLGGEDFTTLLANWFLESNGIKRETLSAKQLASVWKQAEVCKKTLGEDHSAFFRVQVDGQELETSITRSEFENQALPLLLRLRQPIERALSDAGVHPKEIDAVVLIGGATRMPFIKHVTGKLFGQLPFGVIHPDEAVALGTAVQAALKERNETVEELILTDVCPYSLGTSVVKRLNQNDFETGHYLPIIERNTPIPVSKVERLYTIADGQSGITVDIYQGESRHVKNNLKLGELSVEVQPAPAGEQSIDVRYTYDINGLLEVEVTIVKTGEKRRIIVEQNPGSQTKEEMEARMKELQAMKIHPRERTENRLLLAKGERFYEESIGERRQRAAAVLDWFERVLASQNEQDIRHAAERFKQELVLLERWNEFE
ncbi:molecular chaperone HscC [Domibacillus robiginosus]|uniref:molecular chaperone HscC n=1 Tax=Domibacillus robiginosus TaxID=1071054 RepID=UPI00067CD9CF|nr:molecular chaperone HscC [Domibacillus robiginosus]